ncbi:hypothetical protein SSP24_59890 [Streptomyces spinoverrucosus]|uniref:DUF4192 domain-containing protein n=1 Tax=Streptomyces spinoverrucosus TaxID=284043 RepID=A0A4Y3VN30_9ACTN|nr:DUF4192 domain-containing protein [Streptomyces spinoverrucosus]GEC08334.1 hypothetical protein SSP24_59890 [Streptomyces spinoverrucosus]GHB83942.1 hypothetical protein GCM10010397_63980 [Streptomyces spinoverrucosus]
MTNHGETTGSFESDDVTGSGRAHRPNGHDRYDDRLAQDGHALRGGNAHNADSTNCDGPDATHRVTLRTPAELADALPYLLGYRPEDSIVLVALHDRGGRGRFGGRARLGIPANPDDWESVAGQLAHGLVRGSERRGARPEQIVAYVCQEPGQGETGRQVMERLRPLAHKLRLQCGLLDVPVIEALCISDGRFWSYCCDIQECCPAEGLPMGLPGTSVLAAAATYAGIQVRGTLRELRARLQPWETAAALEQEAALDAGSMALVPRMLDDTSRAGVAEETMELARQIMTRLADAAPASGAFMADLRDDGLLRNDEAATLILGLQDRATRDRAAEWMEGAEAAPALRLWRALARRCVGSYGEHAAAPLTLAGWVAWSTGDELEAREALAMALGADPDYLFARLLHQAVNEGLDPESIRRCLRAERDDRARTPAERIDEARGPKGLDTTQGTEGGGGDADGSESVAAVQRRHRGLPAGDAENSHSLTAQEARKSAPPSRRVPAARTGPGTGRTGGTHPPAAAKGGVRRRGTTRRGVASGGGETKGDA